MFLFTFRGYLQHRVSVDPLAAALLLDHRDVSGWARPVHHLAQRIHPHPRHPHFRRSWRSLIILTQEFHLSSGFLG